MSVIGSEGDSSTISLSNGMLSNNLAEEIPATWVRDSVNVTSVLPRDANGGGGKAAACHTKAKQINREGLVKALRAYHKGHCQLVKAMGLPSLDYLVIWLSLLYTK